MAEPSVCPSHMELEQYLLGNVSMPRCEELSQHLESCPRCFSAARSLSANDGLIDALRVAASATVDVPTDVAPMLVERLKKLGQEEPAPAGQEHITLGSEIEATSFGPEGDKQSDYRAMLAPPQQPDEMGRLGQYRVLRILGRGGMGVVLLAQDTRLDRHVALKAMLPRLAENPLAKQRFLREAKAAAKLQNDHIVTIYDVGEERGVPFLAMEYLEGMPLDRLLRLRKQLSPAQILRIGREIARGLTAAHENGLIHRDIKPANIWLDRNGNRVKILDFGLARPVAGDVHLTQSGVIVGTPAYMAPEQARNHKNIDHRIDLFSLGSVLYHLCVGQLPFHGESTMEVLMALAATDPRPPHLCKEGIPLPLSELIMQLLEKDPNRRPTTARDVVNRIQQIERELADARQHTSTACIEPPLAAAVPGTRTPVPAGMILEFEENVPSNVMELATAAEIVLPRQAPARQAPQRKLSRQALALAAAAVLLPILGMTAYFLFFAAPARSTLLVQLDDPQLEVEVLRDGRRTQPRSRERQFVLTPGRGEVLVFDRAGQQLAARPFDLAEGKITPLIFTAADLQAPGPQPRPHDNAGPLPLLKKLRQPLVKRTVKIGTQATSAVAFTPDGGRLAAANADGAVKVFQVGTWDELMSVHYPGQVETLALAHNGNLLAAAGQGQRIHFWDTGSGKPNNQLAKQVSAQVGNAVAFSAEGRYLAWSDRLTGEGGQAMIRRLDLPEMRELPPLRLGKYPCESVLFTPDGRLLVASDGAGQVKVWHTDSGQLAFARQGGKHLRMAHDGRWLASFQGQSLYVWTLPEGHEKLWRQTLTHWERIGPLTRDSRKLFVFGRDRQVHLFDTMSWQCNIAFPLHEGVPGVADLAPQGGLLAVGTQQGEVVLLDLDLPRPQLPRPFLSPRPDDRSQRGPLP